MNQEEKLDLKTSLNEAFDEYRNMSRSPFSKKLGIKNGWLTFLRHHHLKSKRLLIQDIEDDSKDAFNVVVDYLRTHGSLWTNQGHNHSFTNFFLNKLRMTNIGLYKKIIGEAYQIHFVDNKQQTILYRIDNRDEAIISRDGFSLLSRANRPNMRKNVLHGLERTSSLGYTGSHGISTTISTNVFNPIFYYSDRVNSYRITLPEGHNILAIDIVKTARKRGLTLSLYNRALMEVNVMDNIPPEMITHVGKRTALQGKMIIARTTNVLQYVTYPVTAPVALIFSFFNDTNRQTDTYQPSSAGNHGVY